MKIVVRGISEETTKDEIKAIIREYCVAFVLSIKNPSSI